MSNKASLFLGLAVMIASGWAVFTALDWPWRAKLFPLSIGIPVFCLAAAEVLWVLFGTAPRNQTLDFQLSTHLPEKVVLRRTLQAAGWMLGFLAAILLLSFPVAVPLFVFVYLKLQGREGWGLSLVIALAVWVFFYLLFGRLLNIPFLDGWLQTWVGLT